MGRAYIACIVYNAIEQAVARSRCSALRPLNAPHGRKLECAYPASCTRSMHVTLTFCERARAHEVCEHGPTLLRSTSVLTSGVDLQWHMGLASTWWHARSCRR